MARGPRLERGTWRISAEHKLESDWGRSRHKSPALTVVMAASDSEQLTLWMIRWSKSQDSVLTEEWHEGLRTDGNDRDGLDGLVA